MGEYTYEYALNCVELEAILGESIVAYSIGKYGDLSITFETFSAEVWGSQPVKIAVGDKITQVFLEYIPSNSLCLGIRLGINPNAFRIYEIQDNPVLKKALDKELYDLEIERIPHILSRRTY